MSSSRHDDFLFHSRKMLAMETRIGRALMHVFLTSRRDVTTTLTNSKSRGEFVMTHLDMNLFKFGFRRESRRHLVALTGRTAHTAPATDGAYVSSLRPLHNENKSAFLHDAWVMSNASVVFRVLYHDDVHAMVYLVMARSKLSDTLSMLSELPRLVFVSCKNQIYRGSGVTVDGRRED